MHRGSTDYAFLALAHRSNYISAQLVTEMSVLTARVAEFSGQERQQIGLLLVHRSSVVVLN